VTGCCPPNKYEAIFNPRFAHRAARRYERRGPARTERRILAFLEGQALPGMSVLEIGGGVGELQIELLRRGATRATNLELSGTYEAEAQRLLAEAGQQDRVRRHLVDIVEAPDQVEPADVVVLNRVVCCYEDYESLLRAAARHCRRVLVFSHPPRNVLFRAAMTLLNLGMRLTGNDYRAYTHPPQRMLAALQAEGLTPVYRDAGAAWCVQGLTR
jgi:2-polyprenyl-3-methyl-5-hydroxy-6-metoxy-1,4-benzoquinol methylase